LGVLFYTAGTLLGFALWGKVNSHGEHYCGDNGCLHSSKTVSNVGRYPKPTDHRATEDARTSGPKESSPGREPRVDEPKMIGALSTDDTEPSAFSYARYAG